MTPSLNLWLIPVLPLAGAAINGFLGKKSSRTAVSTVGLVFLRRGVRLGAVGCHARLVDRPSLPGISGPLDPLRQFQRRLRFISRSTLAGHAAGRHRSGIPHPHLFRRLHVGRPQLLPLLRLPEPVHVFHADAGAGQQLPADVHRLGGRGPGVVSADRVLVHERFGGIGGKESVHRQPHRRLRIPDRTLPDHSAFRLAGLHEGIRLRRASPRRSGNRDSAHHSRNSADGGRLRQSRRRFRSTSGCPTPWKARRRFRR